MVNRKVKYENSLEYFAKDNNLEYLLHEFSTKNCLSPSEISCGNTQVVLWNCPDCKSEYDMGTYYRTKMKCNCPYCSGKRVNHTNSLLNTFPKISLEWNYSKNGDLTPKHVTGKSSKKVWWICDKGHEWKVVINNRTVNGNGCPYCAGKKTGKENNLTKTHPELCVEWDYDKNNILPSTVSWSNKNEFWWKCSNGHTYQKTVYSKVRYPDCSICNSIAVKRPDLMNEWDFDRNEDDPLNVSFSSGKKVYWKCSNDLNHKWLASPHKRVNGRDCPICSESKGEKIIRKWLDIHNIEFTPQKDFPDLIGLRGGNLSYDFYLPSQNILIEYQGEYHDGSAKQQTDEEFKIQQEHDLRKRNYAKQNNIKLLEIWYWDFNKIKNILNFELNGGNQCQ